MGWLCGCWNWARGHGANNPYPPPHAAGFAGRRPAWRGHTRLLAKTSPRTPRERSGFVFLPRHASGRVLAIDPLRRFVEKCEFDPVTGCVLWRGGTTQGRGNTAVYGSFWFEGRRHFAHRWAGVHIHGLDLDGVQAGHCCPGRPNTLCVQHLVGQTAAANNAEQHARLGPIGKRVEQTSTQRQFWLFVQLGIEHLPEPPAQPDDMPFHEPPAWFRPFMPAAPDICPF